MSTLEEINNRQNETIRKMTTQINKYEALVDKLSDRLNDIESDLESCCLAHNTSTARALTQDEDKAFLKQNFPNPFTENTIIQYYLPHKTISATITITNINGRVITQKELATRGYGQIDVDAYSFMPGTYIYELTIDNKLIDSKKMIIQ